jgi:hypothetical protein
MNQSIVATSDSIFLFFQQFLFINSSNNNHQPMTHKRTTRNEQKSTNLKSTTRQGMTKQLILSAGRYGWEHVQEERHAIELQNVSLFSCDYTVLLTTCMPSVESATALV